jgi:hypothetical protein
MEGAEPMGGDSIVWARLKRRVLRKKVESAGLQK